ncbi:unnamed protein product [marine sediment metagenome]|uniref:Uncharacterized protein n=1 Tax=marine sediment metagenome TaxID=412755 RepID=X1DZ25_9ZZZZ
MGNAYPDKREVHGNYKDTHYRAGYATAQSSKDGILHKLVL